jgi:hypothetical protein
MAWCNKPFQFRALFLARCLKEAALGRHVTNLDTHDISTFVAQTSLRHAHEIIACAGRPKFDKPDKEVEDSPNFGTILYGFGGEISPMLTFGLQGVALIPAERVETMLHAAIKAVRAGASDDEALIAAHAAPAVPAPAETIEALQKNRRARKSAAANAMREAA